MISKVYTNNSKESPPLWGGLSLLMGEGDLKGRPERSEGKKVSGGHFLVRGKIPRFPVAVRRTVNGKREYWCMSIAGLDGGWNNERKI